MKHTTPEIFLIAQPTVNTFEMERYLSSIGGADWVRRTDVVESDAERLIEFAGRACYRSWEPGLNANVTQVRTDSAAYLRNILKSGHGSVLEHAAYTFVFKNVSRVFTHELVRHRVGVAISQESLRYVRLADLSLWLPDALTPETSEQEKIMTSFVSIVEQIENWQFHAANAFGLNDEGVPFSYKKSVTSALRRLAPIGLATTIVWTANVRTLRHVLEMRTSVHAEEEIRLVFQQVGEILRTFAPNLFGDYVVNEQGEWTTQWPGV